MRLLCPQALAAPALPIWIGNYYWLGNFQSEFSSNSLCLCIALVENDWGAHLLFFDVWIACGSLFLVRVLWFRMTLGVLCCYLQSLNQCASEKNGAGCNIKNHTNVFISYSQCSKTWRPRQFYQFRMFSFSNVWSSILIRLRMKLLIARSDPAKGVRNAGWT